MHCIRPVRHGKALNAHFGAMLQFTTILTTLVFAYSVYAPLMTLMTPN